MVLRTLAFPQKFSLLLLRRSMSYLPEGFPATEPRFGATDSRGEVIAGRTPQSTVTQRVTGVI
jgi:hypothetical protein